MRRQRILGPDDSRAPARRTVHGLTADERDALVSLQGGRCAVCGRTDRPLEIDHDHRHCPGTIGCRHCVRGAVCGRCNRAIWGLGDDVEVARRLVGYLERTAA
jgi:Recombination endonuclease VII